MRVRLPLIFILLITSAALLFFVAVPLFVAKKDEGSVSPLLHQSAKAAWVSIDFGNGTRRAFEGPMENSSYPFSLVLKEIIRDADLPIRIEGEEILSGDGSDRIRRGVVYKNGAPVAGPLRALTIASGDQYELRFEK